MRKARDINEISSFWNFIFNLLFIIISAICVLPVLLIFAISITDESSLSQYGYNFIPKEFSLYAYNYLLNSGSDILRAYGVSFFVTIVGTILSVACICFYAYPLSRRDFKYRNFFTFFIFITMLFNGGLVPWYMVCTQMLHIQNTIWAMIVPTMMNAWLVIILRTFFSTTIPEALIESAKIDGSGEFRTFFRIVLPLSLPGLATVGLFVTLAYWNDWWLPLMLINDSKLSNLQFYLYRIITNIEVLADSASAMGANGAVELAKLPKESVRMAICIIAIGPIVLSYPFFQKYLVRGLTVGAVKG